MCFLVFVRCITTTESLVLTFIKASIYYKQLSFIQTIINTLSFWILCFLTPTWSKKTVSKCHSFTKRKNGQLIFLQIAFIFSESHKEKFSSVLSSKKKKKKKSHMFFPSLFLLKNKQNHNLINLMYVAWCNECKRE